MIRRRCASQCWSFIFEGQSPFLSEPERLSTRCWLLLAMMLSLYAIAMLLKAQGLAPCSE